MLDIFHETVDISYEYQRAVHHALDKIFKVRTLNILRLKNLNVPYIITW
jgi:hypothetical protein